MSKLTSADSFQNFQSINSSIPTLRLIQHLFQDLYQFAAFFSVHQKRFFFQQLGIAFSPVFVVFVYQKRDDELVSILQQNCLRNCFPVHVAFVFLANILSEIANDFPVLCCSSALNYIAKAGNSQIKSEKTHINFLSDFDVILSQFESRLYRASVQIWSQKLQQQIMQQQRIESQLIQRLLQKFQYDESQAAREVLEQLISDQQHTREYLEVFERLFNSPSNRTRQRRDVAAIARLIADSPVLASLSTKVKQQSQSGLFTITIQIAKLISNICNENPHFIDNLLNNAPELIHTLLSLLNNPQTTPNDPQSLGIILNFLHNISLKESILRIEKIGPCFESLLENIFTSNRFSNFISKKKFQQFVSSIFKFNSNVPIVARHSFHALFRSASTLNQQYKSIADTYKKISVSLDNQQQLCKITKQLVTFADQKLIAIMNFYSKAKTQMFSKFDALSFHGLLKIFVKIAIVRPVALVNRPMQNKHLINLIAQTIKSIQQYRNDHNLFDQQPSLKQPQKAESISNPLSKINQKKGESIQEDLQILQELKEPLTFNQDSQYGSLLQKQENLPEDHKERIKRLMQSFKRLEEITGCFSENYYRLVISTMNTLEVSFNIVNKFSSTDIQYPENNHIALSEFLIEIMTARLERILRIMVKLFSPQELGKGTFYSQIVANLFKLVPFYFQGTIEAETKVIEEQVQKLEDITVESEGSELRYLMDVLDEEQIKRKLNPLLGQKVSIYSLMYEIILKFSYHLIDDSRFLRQNMNNFVYPFIKLLREKYLNQIDASETLTMKQMGILRLSMKVVVQFFPFTPTAVFEEEIKNKQKIYKYCIMQNEDNSYDKGFLSLFGCILNNLTKHSIEKSQDLLDTVQNRLMVAKSIFSKIMIQRAKVCINSITHSHKSTACSIHDESQAEAIVYFYQFTAKGYYGYLKSMNNFIFQTCSDADSYFFKEQIIGVLLDRTLQYNIMNQTLIDSQEVSKLRYQCLKSINYYVDQQNKRIFNWTFQNIHKYLHKLPILTKRLLHFDKTDPHNHQSTPGDLVFHQEQIVHVRLFYKTICAKLNEVSLALAGRNLDLQVKVSKRSKDGINRQVSIKDEVNRLRNLVVMIGQFSKLLCDQDYLEVAYPQVTANCIYSILGLVGQTIKQKRLDILCPAQTDRLILGTLWMIDQYLDYSSRIRFKSISRKKENNRKNRIKKAQLKESKLLVHHPQTQKPQKMKRKKKRKVHKDEAKVLIKSPSKANLFEENNQMDQKNSHKTSKKRKNKPEESLQKHVKTYLYTICQSLSKYTIPVLTNNTFSFLIHLVSRHSPRSLILSPPYKFQLSLSEILPNLLNLRLSGTRVPGYHNYLCRLALQQFDQAHIKVDYQLSIKRYFFQHSQGPISLQQFLTKLQESFKEISVTTCLLVQITTKGDQGQQIKIPFEKDKCNELMQQIVMNKEKKYFVQLKDGVQMHLINCRTESSSKRKASGPNEQQKPIKVSEYIPEGDLHILIQSIITHSIQLLFTELDRYFNHNPNGISLYQINIASKDNPIGYQTYMQPFTIRTIIQTIHYLVRESPSLTPFIAKYKCKKILLNEISSERIKNKKEVASLILKLIGGTHQPPENMPQIGFLSILIRLFSPLVVNTVSGLIFELCLDSTPLVQLVQSKGNKGHVPFASVIRLKVVQEIENILFQPFSNKWIFRKLCLLNIMTVLLNIREMSKLLLQNNFISKIYKNFKATKAGIAQHIASEGIKCLSNDHIVKLITPFFLSPLGILQQLNINFHHNKKLNKPPQSITICCILSRQAINSQMIPNESLKKYKFSTGWPFGKKHKKIFEMEQGQQRDIDLQSSSDEQDQSDSFDSDNSSEIDSFDFHNRSGIDLQGQMDFDSYISLSQPNEDLLHQQWDYSNSNAQGIEDYPMGDDPILEVEQQADDYSDEQQQNVEESSQQAQIRQYLQQQLQNNEQSQSGIPLSMGMSDYQDGQMNNYMGSNVEGFRQFVLNPINEDDYYNGIQALLNFENIKSCERISKVQKRQVNLLRFYLQIILYQKRMTYNKINTRNLSSAQIKEQQNVQQCLGIQLVFSADQHLKATQYVEYNQIYRFDHFHKDTPKYVEDLQRLFLDYIANNINRCPHQRRRQGFIMHPQNNAIEIIPGWNIVGQRQPSESRSENQDNSLANGQIQNSNGQQSHIMVPSQQGDIDNAMESESSSSMQQMNQQDALAQLLRVSGFQMSLREFRRLDYETQQDILMNLGGRQFVQNDSPQYPNIPLLPIVQDMRPLQQGRILIRQQPQQMVDQQRQPQNERVVEPQPEMQPENQEQMVHPAQQGLRVDENYRKMSLEHCKKLSKDVMQALNKDGKNNSKFYQIEDQQLQNLLSIFYLTQKAEHSKFPYPLFQTLCINTHSLQKIISSLITLLHLTPKRISLIKKHPIVQFTCKQGENQTQLYAKEIYVSAALKILYTLSHLTANYFIAMPFLQINQEVLSCITQYKHQEQSKISSFEMLILLLSEKTFTQSPDLISFLVPVLNNITLHHFYKNVNKIVEKNEQMEEQIITAKVSSSSITLLGMLLQNDYVGDRLQQVSKIIMRLCVEEQNLHNFINYLQKLVQQLTDSALQGLESTMQNENSIKIVNIMSIFYQMVEAFKTYPTTEEHHKGVMNSLRKIVEYQKIQKLCEKGLRILFESNGSNVSTNVGEIVDCFFILHEIAVITSNRKVESKEIQHNRIAQLGQIGLVQQFRNENNLQQQLFLGKFNLTKLWKEAVSHPSFKTFINNSLKKKLNYHNQRSRKSSILDTPIIKIASSTPHMLTFNNKYAIFKAQLKRLRGKQKHSVIQLRIHRQQVFEESFDMLNLKSGAELRGKLKIQFQGQQGQDAGGVTREWFQLLSRQMFNPNYGLFKSGSGGHTYHPSPTSYFNDRDLQYFKFIGMITGKALYDGYLLDAYFTPAFYKHILNLPITYTDMQQEDYQFFKSLTWMLQNSPLQDYLQLDFTYDSDNLGQIQTKELLPGGKDIAVTEQNKVQYVQLIAYAKMATSIKKQLQSFLTGLHQLIPHRLLRIFNEKELEIMISGRPTIDIEDLRKNTELINYTKNDQIILWLFEVLEDFGMEKRTAFIQFVTGSSRVPVQGFKDLRGMNGVQKFSIHREFQEQRLPRAHTCFNQLDLPNYATKQILIQKLTYAITEGKEGFGMI